MITLRTIAEFQRLNTAQQSAILSSLQTKSRLEKWLWSLNDKKPRPAKPDGEPDGWTRCKRCLNHPGWVPEEEARDNSYIHPSAIHKCVRFHWYCCNDFASQMEEKIAPQLRMIFDVGHAWHHVVQSYGKKGAWGEGYTPEVSIEPDALGSDGQPVLPEAARTWIQGHVDAVLSDYFVPSVPGLGDVSLRLMHEYKTINDDGFKRLTKPKFEHRQQATCYQKVLDLPVAVYLYINKNNSSMIDFPLAFDESLWQEIDRERIQPVQRFSAEGQPPSWDLTSARKNPSECRECPFRLSVCRPPLAER